MLRDVVIKFWLSLKRSENVAVLLLHSLAVCTLLIAALCLWEDGTSEIFSRKGCPFCPPYICFPVEMAQWILPLGVFSQEPLRDSAGKLQRCLAHAVPVFHYRSSMPFFYLFLALGSDTQMMLLIQISAGHWGLKLNTRLQTLCFLRFMVREYVCDGVADSKCCETRGSSTVLATVWASCLQPHSCTISLVLLSFI